VYRDVSDPVPPPSSPRRPATDDAAYWYDLLAEDPAPEHEQARGPFEPLQPSRAPADQRPAAGLPPDAPQAAGPGRAEPPEQAQARKLEQLKDLYLTAEAIGEQNVDKHFDQLLAQQRELISDYFRQSATVQAGRDDPGDGQGLDTEAARPDPGITSGEPTPQEGAAVRAEPPGTW
jgi:hypothetical protein